MDVLELCCLEASPSDESDVIGVAGYRHSTDQQAETGFLFVAEIEIGISQEA